MLSIFQNESKIKIYSQIQENLINLEFNSADESIFQVINKIPDRLLKNKEDLMTICSIFSFYGSISFYSFRNCAKLFEYILPSIKIYLQNESSFLWEIFGNLSYFKLWMHEEELITIDQIILSVQNTSNSSVVEYFLPEIINEFPEAYKKEIKFILKKDVSNDDINQFKKLRTKRIKWMWDSFQFSDINYKQIENNKLLLSIQMDDIDTFQKILAEKNLPIFHQINDSFHSTNEMTLIECSAYYNSMKIFKFLVMNGADVQNDSIFYSIQNKNYDMFHIIESLLKEKLTSEIIDHSILSWSDEVTKYEIEKSGIVIETENDERILNLIYLTFRSVNFVFFENTILPFLQRNPDFVDRNIYRLIILSFNDQSCFFLRELLKYQGLDINHQDETNGNKSLIFNAISSRNSTAVEIIFQNKKFNFNDVYRNLTPLQYAMQMKSDMKIIKMISKHRKVNVYFINANSNTAARIAILNGNFIAAQYLYDNYSLDGLVDNTIICVCISRRNLMSAKLAMKYFYETQPNLNIDSLIRGFEFIGIVREDYIIELKQIYNDVINNATIYSEIKHRKNFIMNIIVLIEGLILIFLFIKYFKMQKNP